MSNKKDDAPQQKDGETQAQGGSELCEMDIVLQGLNVSWKLLSFKDLGLSGGFFDTLSCMRPSKIQSYAVPILLAHPHTNMIVQSPHGTGKTTALVLYILRRLNLATEQMTKTPQALVLVHCQEESHEMVRLFLKYGNYFNPFGHQCKGLVVMEVVPSTLRLQPLEASVIVGTPGSIRGQIQRRMLITQNIKILMLDGVDIMLDSQGLGDQCLRVKGMLLRTSQQTIQLVLSSVSLPKAVFKYANEFAPYAHKLYLKQDESTIAEGIKQLYIDIDFKDDNDKFRILLGLYKINCISSSIIFVKSRITGLEIEKRMKAEGYKAEYLSDNIELSKSKNDIISDFCSQKTEMLITSTSQLRHDINTTWTVTMVINYDIPRYNQQPEPATYLHRSRHISGFSHYGIYVTFVAGEAEREMLMDIKKSLHTNIDCMNLRVIEDALDDAEGVIDVFRLSQRSYQRSCQGQQSYKIIFDAAKRIDETSTKIGPVSSGFPVSSIQKPLTLLPSNPLPRQNLVQQVKTQSLTSAVYTNTTNAGAQDTMNKESDCLPSNRLTLATPTGISLAEDDEEGHPKKLCRGTDEWILRFKKCIRDNLNSTSSKTPRIKVAILDSGIEMRNTDIDAQSERIMDIRSWIDGKDGVKTTICGDHSGHGTHIAGIILDLAPNVDIYIARVTKKRDLDDTRPIVKAFNYARKIWKVDMITMSLGFQDDIPQLETDIKDAVHRGTIVFAAASNDGGNSAIAFPASLSDVICVLSTDSHGNLAPYNPSPNNHPRGFSILGEHINSSSHDTSVAGACRRMSGTSVATPVAVAMAAFLIEYIRQEIPSLRKSTKLKTCNGISSIFQLLVNANGSRPTGYNLITPFRFFEELPKGKIREDIKHALNNPYRPGQV